MITIDELFKERKELVLPHNFNYQELSSPFRVAHCDAHVNISIEYLDITTREWMNENIDLYNSGMRLKIQGTGEMRITSDNHFWDGAVVLIEIPKIKPFYGHLYFIEWSIDKVIYFCHPEL